MPFVKADDGKSREPDSPRSEISSAHMHLIADVISFGAATCKTSLAAVDCRPLRCRATSRASATTPTKPLRDWFIYYVGGGRASSLTPQQLPTTTQRLLGALR